MKKIIFFLIFITLTSACFAKESPHRFGITFEGGTSIAFMARADNGQPWHELYGTAGGTFFYQYRISKYLAIRPELGLYSYFFGVPGPGSIGSDEIFATLNTRIGLGLSIYTFSSKHISFPVTFSPFVSARLYDSAGKAKTGFSDCELPIVRNNYFSGGIQIALGVEFKGSYTSAGGGFSIFTRFGDQLSTGGQGTGIIPSFGALITVFW
ncbi:MAG TPA: hypothetical protein PKG52_08705 [bacterium]|nr:hypothetical protein [bacterium]